MREIIENFQLEKIVAKLVKNDLLFMLVEKFTEVDLSPAERDQPRDGLYLRRTAAALLGNVERDGG